MSKAAPSRRERGKQPAAATRGGRKSSGSRIARISPQHLGSQIRDLRKARNLTLASLAERIERSIGYLSQIERGKSAVTISALQEIADALGVQIAWFFQGHQPGDPSEAETVVRSGNRRRLDFPGSGVQEELLSPTLSGQLELILTTFKPGSSTGDRDRLRRGEEAGYLISGSLDLIVDGKRLHLEAGDSFAFTRKGPHRCLNPGGTDAVVLWVITPPSY
jgi:transcriptional regulator with XRE-family HTH domain